MGTAKRTNPAQGGTSGPTNILITSMPQAMHNPIQSHLSDKEKEILIDHIDSDDLPSLAIDMNKFGINFVIQELLPTQKYQTME